MKIAFLGLGAMGSRMAMTIVKAGHDVAVWNRSPGRADALTEAGATEAGSPADAARDAAIVVSMVMDDAASRVVWTDPDTGALSAMTEGAVAVECSTISPEWGADLAQAANAAGLAFVDAPVAGTLPPAESGELVILAGGTAEAIDRAAPALDAMGKATHHAGPNGAGIATKLLVNGMLAAQEAALAELLSLIEGLGHDRIRAFEILCETPIASPMLKTYGKLMLDGTDEVLFPVDGILKDLGLMIDAAETTARDVPVIKGAAAGFKLAKGAGLGGANQTEILRAHERAARARDRSAGDQ
ncbi:3-hydroxyisobutyrate dehydrogenase [Roseivivax jejudonensis]|uniref:3-hydroxyisobutyrate dehydrogenase n=1 Tax=Roseivivax jejudonensis TaxID=1529041 RepID=A0A1X6YH38_9RHOB|nr:NAD(P)-dependent oxidoreductase [Roseivivax jejudonensis]SLN21375.1 3-hydroxyisobutyrate dehydrogenase [Roseivivax jejudonensis]